MGKKKQESTEESSDPQSTEQSQSEESYVVPETVEGPNDEQACSDAFFLILFLLFWIGMIVVGGIAFKQGDPSRLTLGTDMYGNQCGKDNNIDGVPPHDLTDYPVLVFPKPTTTKISYCAKECPTVLASSFTPNATEVLCYYVQDKDSETGWSTPEPLRPPFGCNVWPCPGDNQCYPSYKSSEILGRCVPSTDNIPPYNDTGSVQGDLNANSNTAQKLMEDVNRAKFLILASCFVAVAISFVWLLILKIMAGFFVWGSILMVWLFFAFIVAYFAYSWDDQKRSIEAREADGEVIPDAQKDNVTTALVIWIIFAVVLFFYTCLILWFRKSINLAIDILQEASNALRYLWTLIFYPLVPFFLLMLFFVWFIAVYFFLATAGDNLVNTEVPDAGQGVNGTTPLSEFEPDNVLRGFQYYHIFGLFWTCAFLIGCAQMTIATAVAIWFYSPKKTKTDDDGTVEHTSEPAGSLGYPVANAMWYTFRYHLGSVALGSLIIAICQFISFLLENFQKSLGGENECLQKVAACLKYLFDCLERFLRFISKNAYIVIAIEGNDINFCKAAKYAFGLLIENASNLFAVSMVSAFLAFLGKIFITFTTAIIFLFILRSDDEYNFWIFPFIVIVILAFFIASAFMELYDMTIDTIFVCVCRDMRKSNEGNKTFEAANWTPGEVDKYIRKIKTDPTAAAAVSKLSPAEQAALAENNQGKGASAASSAKSSKK